MPLQRFREAKTPKYVLDKVATKNPWLLGKGGPGAYARNAAGTRHNAAIASGVPGAFSEHSFGRPKECCPPRRVALGNKDGLSESSEASEKPGD